MGDEDLREQLMEARQRIGRLEREIDDVKLWCSNIVLKITELENRGSGQPESEG